MYVLQCILCDKTVVLYWVLYSSLQGSLHILDSLWREGDISEYTTERAATPERSWSYYTSVEVDSR